MATLRETVDALKISVEQVLARINTPSEEVASLHQQIDDMRAADVARDATIDGLTAEIAVLNAKLVDAVNPPAVMEHEEPSAVFVEPEAEIPPAAPEAAA